MVVSATTKDLEAFEDLLIRQAISQDFLNLLAEASEFSALPDSALSYLRQELPVNRERHLRHTIGRIDV